MQTTNCVDVRPIPGFSISQLPNLNPGCILCRLWRYAKHLRRGVQKWQAHWRTIVQSLAGRRVIKEAENRPKMRCQDCKISNFLVEHASKLPRPHPTPPRKCFSIPIQDVFVHLANHFEELGVAIPSACRLHRMFFSFWQHFVLEHYHRLVDLHGIG